MGRSQQMILESLLAQGRQSDYERKLETIRNRRRKKVDREIESEHAAALDEWETADTED